MVEQTLYTALKNIEGLRSVDAVRETIEKYRRNPFLEKVIEGECSLETTCRELAKPFEGRTITPHHKDVEHNKKVAQLGELIPVNLYQRGFYYPDNLVTNLSYAALGMGGLHLSTQMPKEGALLGVSILLGSGLLLGSFFTAVSGVYYNRRIQESINAATYVDVVIKESNLTGK